MGEQADDDRHKGNDVDDRQQRYEVVLDRVWDRVRGDAAARIRMVVACGHRDERQQPEHSEHEHPGSDRSSHRGKPMPKGAG